MKCGNCKHFEPIIFPPSSKLQSGEWGICEQIFKKNQVDTESNSITFGEGSDYNYIAVGKNFCCIHFENKDK